MTRPAPDPAPEPALDPEVQRLLARGGLYALPLTAPDVWPHGPLAAGERQRVVGNDSLSAGYCTFQGHRFLRAHLLLPIQGARTVLGCETWASVSEASWQAWLTARAGGDTFAGAFAWLANRIAGFETPDPVPCNLTAGPPGALPRLQPHPGHDLARAQADGITPEVFHAICAGNGGPDGPADPRARPDRGH